MQPSRHNQNHIKRGKAIEVFVNLKRGHRVVRVVETPIATCQRETAETFQVPRVSETGASETGLPCDTTRARSHDVLVQHSFIVVFHGCVASADPASRVNAATAAKLRVAIKFFHGASVRIYEGTSDSRRAGCGCFYYSLISAIQTNLQSALRLEHS